MQWHTEIFIIHYSLGFYYKFPPFRSTFQIFSLIPVVHSSLNTSFTILSLLISTYDLYTADSCCRLSFQISYMNPSEVRGLLTEGIKQSRIQCKFATTLAAESNFERFRSTLDDGLKRTWGVLGTLPEGPVMEWARNKLSPSLCLINTSEERSQGSVTYRDFRHSPQS